jgi:hypothetical protein
VEREVYQTWRVVCLTDTWTADCMRCGARVRTGDVGYATRQRGTSFKEKRSYHLHRRCVPTTEFMAAGVPARKVRRA